MRVKTSTLFAIFVVAISLTGCNKSNNKVTGMPTSPEGEADMLISQITAFLDDNLFDSADRNLARLDELKPRLPADYGTKIDKARQLVVAAKAKKK